MEEKTALTVQNDAELMEKVLLEGDLSRLTPGERLRYYDGVCRSLSLNPTTRPFDYIKLNGKLVLYARKDATEQLRKVNGVSIVGLDKEWKDNLGLYIVTARASDKSGRTDAATGAVAIKGLMGDNLANAVMKAETKAKRRVTLSICGMGIMDESEIHSIPDAQPVVVTESGDVIEAEITVSTEKKDEPQKPATTPEPEKATVEMMAWFSGKQVPADGLIDIKTINAINEKFVGKGKPLDAAAHLKNHLRKHYHVDTLQEMTWKKTKALITHLKGEGDDPDWYPPEKTEIHDVTTSSGYSDDYLDRVVVAWSKLDPRLGGVARYSDLPNEKKVDLMELLNSSVGEGKPISNPENLDAIAGVLSA